MSIARWLSLASTSCSGLPGNYILPAELVRSVLHAKDIESFDHPMPCVRGVVAAGGRSVPVLDVRQRLGHIHENGDLRTVLVFDPGIEGGPPLVGIAAGQVTEVIELNDRDLRGRVIRMRKAGRPYGRPKTLFSLANLFSSDELVQITAAKPTF